jgi:hypothetical protein
VSATVVEWTNCAVLSLQSRDPWLLTDDAWAMASALGQRVSWSFEPESAVAQAFHHEAFAIEVKTARTVPCSPDLRSSPFASAQVNGNDLRSTREIVEHVLLAELFPSTQELGNGA